ncbi:cysteine hydrolase family protein [Pseudonocardia pini]|uniref:cysteine hydrolase family protein n=1 Tax=Pseudonocardia pini TaxID=2758030 RepID=UPI0015F0A39E|nr:cysteine hydrolase [Pseudonocardia pini]
MTTALVVSECQQGVLDPALAFLPGLAEQAAETGIVSRIAVLAAAFREAGLPVVHCHIAHRPDLAGMRANSLLGALALKHRSMIAGTPAVETPPELRPAPEDHVSSRSLGLTPFYGTDLDAVLRLRGVETVVLTGVSTDVAVPGLAMEAVNRGYAVQVAADCVAGSSAENQAFALANQLRVLARITDSARVLAALS